MIRENHLFATEWRGERRKEGRKEFGAYYTALQEKRKDVRTNARLCFPFLQLEDDDDDDDDEAEEEAAIVPKFHGAPSFPHPTNSCCHLMRVRDAAAAASWAHFCPEIVSVRMISPCVPLHA